MKKNSAVNNATDRSTQPYEKRPIYRMVRDILRETPVVTGHDAENTKVFHL